MSKLIITARHGMWPEICILVLGPGYTKYSQIPALVLVLESLHCVQNKKLSCRRSLQQLVGTPQYHWKLYKVHAKLQDGGQWRSLIFSPPPLTVVSTKLFCINPVSTEASNRGYTALVCNQPLRLSQTATLSWMVNEYQQRNSDSGLWLGR